MAPVEVELLERVVGLHIGQDEGEVAQVLDVQLGRVPVVRQLREGRDPVAFPINDIINNIEKTMQVRHK